MFDRGGSAGLYPTQTVSGAGTDNDIILRTHDKNEYNMALLQARQQNLLAKQWRKAEFDITNKTLANLTTIKMMYRDADLMDDFPEIGAAVDIVMEESTYMNDKGFMLNISSKSERIKKILQDLFYNKLQININLPMICRAMVKYGNEFMLLNIDKDNGVMGWKQLPVYEIERFENGMLNPYTAPYSSLNTINPDIPQDTQFIWVGQNEFIPYQHWQIAHFRLLYDSRFLPYGVSFLQKARRHFRMLSMMEDMMLIYRMERSWERRVFKVNVGGVDPEDVPALVQEVANNFKRTPIIDPQTGQIDLRKNILPVWKNTPIPLLDGRTITIEDLAKEYENGKTNYVYSIQDDTKQIVPGKVVWCGKNYTANTMIKVTLDDDSYVVLAPEHEFIMRDGSKKRADELEIGESVMPFYRECDPKAEKYLDRYEKVYNPNSGKYEYTHRLVANEVEKGCDDFNTVHHVDYNKYNNEPTNLLWCDFNEHHKMHAEVGRRNWADEEKASRTALKISMANRGRKISEETKQRISKTIKDKYANGELMHEHHPMSDEKRDYLRLKTHFANIENSTYDKYLRKYNESELHKQHDKIRSQVMSDFWDDIEKAEVAKRKMTVVFDDFVWSSLREAILKGIIYNRVTMLEYINTFLIEHLKEINTNKRLRKLNRISREVLETRINEMGFATITEYIASMKKNHKVANIEYIKGDDVYCMTVVGLNGEEDRHNFALRSFVGNDEWNDSGCFVSNCSTEDYFIPVRDDSAPNPIETLSAAQNLTAIDDLKFIEDKVLTALRVPKSFVSFDTEKAEGKNLSLLDIRFTKTVNRIQQYLIMELNRIAMIHLELLGFEDDITNFNLTMNNPSSQAQMLELENTSKKITAAKDAVSDPGGGIPLYSMTRAWKEILGWSDKEIKDNLEEIRLEKAMSIEIENTAQIIKRTHIFDPVDNIYGEPGAEYQPQQQGGGDDGGMMGGGGGGGLGGALDFGGSDMGGAEGEMDMSDAAAEETSDAGMEPEPNGGGIDSGEPPANLAESVLRSLEKNVNKKKQAIAQRNINMGRHYLDLLESRIDSYAKEKETVESFDDLRLLHHNHLLNEQLADIHKQLDEKESLNKSYKLLTEDKE